jgi:hypothetical protein
VGFAAAAKVSVINSKLADNHAGSGGAISTFGGGNLTQVHGSNFTYNNASYGGGLLADELSTMFFKACLLESNTAVGGGGVLQARAHAQVRGAIGQAAKRLPITLSACVDSRYAVSLSRHSGCDRSQR